MSNFYDHKGHGITYIQSPSGLESPMVRLETGSTEDYRMEFLDCSRL